jgi:DNA-directed RNA polymerase subunit L
MTVAMTDERTDFSHYGSKFQEGLAQLILDDRVFADQISEVLDYQYLEVRYLKEFVSKIFDYRDKYGTHPSRDTMAIIIRAELEDINEVVRRQMRDYYARVYASPTEVDGAAHIKEVSLDFCRKQKLKAAMLKCVGLIKSSSFDEISKTMNDALSLGADNDSGYDYILDFEKRFEIKSRNPVSTGWQQLDSICRGGLGAGELGVCIAPTGAGKSMALVHLGAQGILEGKTVVHYTLELADTVVATRYDSCITGIPLNTTFSNKEKIFDAIKDIEGQLIVKEYPTKSASTKTITAHLDKLRRRGVNPGMIIVDYGDLLRPVTVQREKRNELESIYEELRAIAQIYECPVWTASQTNRSGLNAEVITMESISEAFNKCFVADFIFSLSRTIEDKNANEGRFFIAKNRNGPDGIVYPIFMDTTNVKIKVVAGSGMTPNQAVSKSSKEQAQSLKDRYKAFRTTKNKEE